MTGLDNLISFAEQLLRVVAVLGFSAGISAVIAYWLFTTLGNKWLDTKFQERLEDYKHAQLRELEQLKLKINTLFDRTTKLHQREFEVLPEAWAKLSDAFWKTMSFTSAVQTYPDLNSMSPPHLQEFLDGCQLGKWEKEEIKTQTDKNKYYIEHIFWTRLVDTRTIVVDANSYIMKNGIFLPADLKEKFDRLSDLIWNALLERQHNEQYKLVPAPQDKQKHLQDKGQVLLKELAGEVCRRLWSSQKEIL